MTPDVNDLGRHIQSCTEMKCMQLLSDGKVTEDQGLLCADLMPRLFCGVNTSALRETFMNKAIKVLRLQLPLMVVWF